MTSSRQKLQQQQQQQQQATSNKQQATSNNYIINMKITQVSIQTLAILVAATSINAASLRGAANDDKAPMPPSSYRPTIVYNTMM
eukprot:scaffold33570_cov126-Skeletonema_dohrnii-CCMP3373.AAC.1